MESSCEGFMKEENSCVGLMKEESSCVEFITKGGVGRI